MLPALEAALGSARTITSFPYVALARAPSDRFGQDQFTVIRADGPFREYQIALMLMRTAFLSVDCDMCAGN